MALVDLPGYVTEDCALYCQKCAIDWAHRMGHPSLARAIQEEAVDYEHDCGHCHCEGCGARFIAEVRLPDETPEDSPSLDPPWWSDR